MWATMWRIWLKNKHKVKRLHRGTGGVGKTILVGIKDRESGNVR